MSVSAVDIPHLLKKYRLHPDKSLGQNFLLDPDALSQVVDAAEITPEDTVLEIGAGLGSLTRLMAATARKIVAVEVDSRLIPPLVEVVSQFSNVEVIKGDILALDPVQLVQDQAYLVVANIPYYITSALIRHLLESPLPPLKLVLTIQKEVAERICAQPGEMSLLSLSVQVYGLPAITSHIPARAFYPPPSVDSAVIRIDLYPTPLIPQIQLDTFFMLTKAGFSQKRKTLRNALSAGIHLPTSEVASMLQEVGIDPMRRAETLSIPEWQQLTETYRNFSKSES